MVFRILAKAKIAIRHKVNRWGALFLIAVLFGVYLTYTPRLADRAFADLSNSAQFISQNVPDEMAAGQKYYPNITFKNTGTASWTRSDVFRLGSQSPQDNTTWGTNRFNLETGDVIAPGQSKTFTMPITAPATPGNYIFQWRMVQELVGWFGDISQSVTVAVSPTGPTNLSPNGNFISSGTASVNISWSPAPGAASYTLGVRDYTDSSLRDPRNNCSGYYLCQSNFTATSISMPVRPGHVYYWWVTAKNAAGQTSIAENAIFAVETDATVGSAEKLVGPVVFHNFRSKDTGKPSGAGQYQTVWLPLEGRSAWDGSATFWKKQTRDIIDSGSNFIFFEVSRPDWNEEMANHLTAINQLASEGYIVPKIAPYFHPSSWSMNASSPPFDLTSAAGKDAFYQVIKNWFTSYLGILPNDKLVRVSGKVLIGLWEIPGCSSAPSDIFAYLNGRLQADFGFNGFWSATPCWSSRQPDEISFLFSGLPSIKFGNKDNVVLRPGVWRPYETIYRPNVFIPRAGGSTYSSAWAQALAQKTQLARIYLTSWNEYTEGSGLYEAQAAIHTESDTHPTAYLGPYSVDINSCWDSPCHPIPHNDSWGSDPRLYINVTKEKAAQFLPASGSDTTPPSVSIAQPVNGSMVAGNVPFLADATDNVGVVGVQFKIDGVNWGVEQTLAPFDAVWNSLSVANGSHTISATARDAAGNTQTSSLIIVTVNNISSSPPDTTAPTIPTNLTATAVSPSQINLSWSASTDNVGVAGYKIYRGGIQIATSPTTSFQNTGLAASTSYSYTVSAYDAAGNSSAQSAGVSATTQAPPPTPDTTPPSTPANLSASAVSASQINLSWNPSTDNVGVVGYKVYRNGTQIAISNTASFQDTGLSASTSYSYTVSAYDAAGNNSSQSTSASATTQAITPPPDTTPPVISSINATVISPTSTVVAWVTNEPADSQVEFGTSIAYFASTFLDSLLVTSHSLILNNLTPGTLYNFRVKSKDAANNLALSGNNTFTTPLISAPPAVDTSPPTVPENLQAIDVRSDQVTLSWNASTDEGSAVSSGVAGYKIFRNGNLITVVSGTIYTDKTVAAQSSYAYSISAFDLAGNNSPHSQTINVNTPAPTPTPTPTSTAATRLINSSGTFYLIQNGARQGITNPDMLYTYGFEFKDALPATPADLALPEGSPLLPANGSLVKSPIDPTVYLISQGKKQGFVSAEVFSALGFKFTSILTVTAPELDQLPLGNIISDSTIPHPDGFDVNQDGTIYWINSQTKHGYPSMEVYNSWHIDNDFSFVVPANALDRNLPVGDVVGLRKLQ